MRVGVVGLGKVGLPLALTLAHYGKHEVVGLDVNLQRVTGRLLDRQDHGEAGLGHLIGEAAGGLHLTDHYGELVALAEVVFVVVPTPMPPGYAGSEPLDGRPLRGFDLTPLLHAYAALSVEAARQERDLTVAVVSTVLPGDLAALHGPSRGIGGLRLVYNPAFVALGSVIRNLLDPDLLLLGHNPDPAGMTAAREVHDAWRPALTSPQVPVHYCTVESAELLKVALNGFLSQRIVFANHLAELCQDIPNADVDEVLGGIARSRLVTGGAFLGAGMGDGGPCRPRDLVALAWLEDRLDASHDLFGQVLLARERQARQLARAAADLATQDPDRPLPVRVLGWSYKPGSTITDGSAARLVHHELEQLVGDVRAYDPIAFPALWPPPGGPAVWVLATPHREFQGFPYPPGSTVLDPWGTVEDQPDVTVVRWGRP